MTNHVVYTFAFVQSETASAVCGMLQYCYRLVCMLSHEMYIHTLFLCFIYFSSFILVCKLTYNCVQLSVSITTVSLMLHL